MPKKSDGSGTIYQRGEIWWVRTAFHNARKRTPPKVNQVPYFPMIQETTVRKGFLTHLLQFAMEVVAWHSIRGF
jgi:hypothetical protein